MPQPNDLSRSLTALDQDSTLIAVVELSQSSWLVGAIIPGVERCPVKKLEATASLARGGGQGGVRDRPHRGGIRGPAATGFGWPAGCGRAAWRRM
jgi:hypothetical protein